MTSACQKLPIPISASRQIGARPSRLSQIENTVAQMLSKPSGNNAYRRKICKTDDQAERTNRANASCPARYKATAPLKSP
jgi:hypothetical protein